LLKEYYAWDGANLRLNIFLQPGASRNALIGVHNQAVKVSLTSPPVAGEANKQLIQFLAALFKVKKSSVDILSGEHSRHKHVIVYKPSQLPEIFSK